MSQENINKIIHAGKFFEQEVIPAKQPTPEKPPEVRRKRSVIDAFIPHQEDLMKKKVDALMEEIGKVHPEPVKEGVIEEEVTPIKEETINRARQDFNLYLLTPPKIPPFMAVF